MTVGDKMHQCLSSLETATADLKGFALDTKDTNAKKMFNDYAKQLEGITSGVRNRVNDIERQEPQYKVRENF